MRAFCWQPQPRSKYTKYTMSKLQETIQVESIGQERGSSHNYRNRERSSRMARG